MSVEEVLRRVRRTHTVTFQRTVETVDVVLKEKSHRVEVYESNGRYGFSIFEYRDLDQETTVLSLANYSKPEYTGVHAALTAGLQSLGYRC